LDVAAALRAEAARARSPALAMETRTGAQRFAGGKGRGGDFESI
jgi:hypothetical protein